MDSNLSRQEANSKRIQEIDRCFGKCGRPLCEPGRILIAEGVLLEKVNEAFEPIQVFLFNDLLVTGAIVESKKRFKRKLVLRLEEVSLESEAGEHCWRVRCPAVSLILAAQTEEERLEWTRRLRGCTLRQEEARRRTPTYWAPDEDAEACMRCQLTRFSLFRRRHHCRKCGLVVCGACSSRRFLLPRMGDKPVRVCDDCFLSLSKAMGIIKAAVGAPLSSHESFEMSLTSDVALPEIFSDLPMHYIKAL